MLLLLPRLPLRNPPDRRDAPARITSTRRLGLVVATWLLLASVANATDGVLEINQTCAVHTGCFELDAPGFPVSINDLVVAKSFRLTSDLVVPETSDGIQIASDFVEIDLNGFRIVSSQCETATSMCNSFAFNSDGITSLTDSNESTVQNGSVIGMNGTGIDLNENSRVENVTVKWSGREGIRTEENSIVVDNYVLENGLFAGTGAPPGIIIAAGSVARGNKAIGNASTGIEANGAGSVVLGNAVVGNGLIGILTLSGATEITGNLVNDNGTTGIFASDGSTISGNTITRNGTTGITAYSGSSIFDNVVFENGDNGITAESGTSLQRNNLRANGNRGLSLLSGSVYRENRMTINTGGNVVGQGLNMGDNACDNATTCP